LVHLPYLNKILYKTQQELCQNIVCNTSIDINTPVGCNITDYVHKLLSIL